jgi:hypothetical protein
MHDRHVVCVCHMITCASCFHTGSGPSATSTRDASPPPSSTPPRQMLLFRPNPPPPPPARDFTTAELLVYEPHDFRVIQRHPLFIGETHLGRKPPRDSQHRIIIPGPSVSSHHATIEIEALPPVVTWFPSYVRTEQGQVWDRDKIYVTDVGSKNFTFTQTTPSDPSIKLPVNKPRVVKLGEFIKLGDVYTSIAIKVSTTTTTPLLSTCEACLSPPLRVFRNLSLSHLRLLRLFRPPHHQSAPVQL